MKKTLLILCLGAIATLPALALAQGTDAGSGSGSASGGNNGGTAGPRGGGPRDPEKMREMFEARFKKADANGDGKLTRAEAQAGMPRIAQNFDAIDANKDGFVTPEEIRAAMAKRGGARRGGAQGGQGGQSAQ